MEFQNRISTEIPESDVRDILKAIDYIDDLLSDLVTLSKEERDALYQCGQNETVPFVLDAVAYAKKHPEVIPEHVNLSEMMKDVNLLQSIDQIKKPLRELLKKLDDSGKLASSEAYVPAIAIFNRLRLSINKQLSHRL